MDLGFRNRKNYGVSIGEIENPEWMVKAVGPSGAAIFANTSECFHRADIPEEGRQRDLIEIQVRPSRRPLAEDWWDHMNRTVFD